MTEPASLIMNIATALALAQAELTNPVKNREVTVQPKEGRAYTFRYATLDSIMDLVRPILAKHGISVMHGIISEGDNALMRTTLLHKTGESLHADVRMFIDRAGNQALGSASSYARRYGLIGLLALAAGDEDDDGNEGDGNQKQIGVTPSPRAAPAERPARGLAIDTEHTTIAKGLLKGPLAEKIRELNKNMSLPDWAAVNALAGPRLASYVLALDAIQKPNL